MAADWLFRVSPRWLLPCGLSLLVAVVFTVTWALPENSVARSTYSQRQILGTVIMFTLLPGYLTWGLIELRFRTLAFVAQLETSLHAEDSARIVHLADRFPWITLPLVLFGGWYGLEQNSYMFDQLMQGTGNRFDAVFIGSNVLVWALIGVFYAWRVRVSLALSRAGTRAEVDLYHLDRVKPFTRIAMLDVLVIAGAMAMMPLQSLDAEFRLVNYQAGMMVGIPAAVFFFALPVFGISRRIREVKQQRLAEIEQVLAGIAREEIQQLEQVSAHQARIRGIPSVPFDINLLWRILVYVIIPPIAWVFAALVENLVDQF